MDCGLIVVFSESFEGDFMEESKLSIWVVRSLTAEFGLLNFFGVPPCLESDSLRGVCGGITNGLTRVEEFADVSRA